uniref:C-type lectin domain-containing protein n=1 Tax=Scleropages formosus TaxID=113540 RepID=A0A8C9VV44_SCLFO
MEQSVTFLLLDSSNCVSSYNTGLCPLSSCLPHQYHFVNMSKNWTEAQSYCRKNYTDLVTIDNPEEMNRVINRVNLTGYTGPAWIGLEKGNSWKWQWSLADTPSYNENDIGLWDKAANQPNWMIGGTEDCGRLENLKWHDYPCNFKAYFVCYNGKLSDHISF